MRCGCPECGTYMIQSEGLNLGCVCPDCGGRCNACMGTNSVISREELQRRKNTDWFQPEFDSPVGEKPSAPGEDE